MTPKFIRFDLYDTTEPENFGGHAYIEVGSITAVVDTVIDKDKPPRTLIHTCGRTFTVRHPVMAVLQSIDSASIDTKQASA